MYGDALISAAIIMFILPIVLSIFWMATLTVYKAYYWDHILQDTITYLEVAKASYYKNGTIEAGVYNSQFTMSPSEKIIYKTHIKPVVMPSTINLLSILYQLIWRGYIEGRGYRNGNWEE